MPAVTPQLVALLPSASTTRSRIMSALEETMRMHPCFNMKQFKSRVENMFAWAKEEDGKSSASASSSNSNPKADFARSIFFPSGAPSTPAPKSPPTLTFFASVAAAFALGVLICKENEAASDAEQARNGGAKAARMDESAPSQRSSAWHKCSPTGLHMLSMQALATNEFTNMYDTDYLIASIMQILFLLHDGKPRVAHSVYPLVGKMVNIAQMMGLSADPDEFPGKYGLFEAEMRRRVWWDVYYYDVFVADCMGQAPTIQDNSYTTKMPADVDEEQFCPSSTSLPVPVPRAAGGDPSEVGFAYFTQKCRYVVVAVAISVHIGVSDARNTVLHSW
ncbi:hypothetical protein DENSPDRAFT_777559 [Dentipellis sp. KUC8613]|nr:hypothetical protein DENSPDRAFT_777559 [Dentipellis sp. KUC8613]